MVAMPVKETRNTGDIALPPSPQGMMNYLPSGKELFSLTSYFNSSMCIYNSEISLHHFDK